MNETEYSSETEVVVDESLPEVDTVPFTENPSESNLEDNPSDVQMVVETRTITSNDTNGLLSIMLDLIGDYDLVTKTVTYTNSSGYQSVQVTTETNYPWLCSCAIFLAVLWCCFRAIGGVLSG